MIPNVSPWHYLCKTACAGCVAVTRQTSIEKRMRWMPSLIVCLVCLTSLAAVTNGARPAPRPLVTSSPYDTLDTAGLTRLRLPFGNAQITKYAFPETWEYNPKTGKVVDMEDHPMGLDSVLRGLPKPYNRLYMTDVPIVARIRPDSSLIDPFLLRSDYYKVDRNIGPIGYYVYDSTVVVLYKDGGAFQPLIGEPDLAILQYIYLFAYHKGRMRDQLLVYYEDISPYEKNSRYFYLNKKGQVFVREFYNGELESSAGPLVKFQIGPTGMFE
jgi:hypothetical protein